jgi:hypothetical protein
VQAKLATLQAPQVEAVNRAWALRQAKSTKYSGGHSHQPRMWRDRGSWLAITPFGTPPTLSIQAATTRHILTSVRRRETEQSRSDMFRLNAPAGQLEGVGSTVSDQLTTAKSDVFSRVPT